MRWARQFVSQFIKIEIVAPLPVPRRFLTTLFIAVFIFGAAYFFHQNFNIQFAQIVAYRHFFTDANLPAIIGDFLSVPMGLAVVAVGLLLIAERIRARFARKFFFALMPIIGLTAISALGFYTGAIDYFRQQSQPPSTFYDKHYLSQGVTISFPEKKRNLIVIFVESLETGFLTPADGGAFDDDCLPNVKKLAETNLNFSHNEKIGGAAQCYGTGWTLAGIVASFTGVPETLSLWATGDNNLGVLGEKFMPSAVSLGDILAATGYRNYFLCGSDAAFAGRDKFFKTHGNATIYDYQYFRNHHYFPDNYRVWWGFEDRKLYAYAQEKLTAAAQAESPFCFTMLTVDTHPVGGYLDPQAEQKFPARFHNVVADADKLLGEFIAWLQQQDFYENTTVVILSDHLYMDYSAFPGNAATQPSRHAEMFGVTSRHPLNIFINSPLSPKFAKNRQFSHFDIFPTLVEAVGGKINAPGLGLGRSMSSGEKTLLEEFGYVALNDQLARPSRRYDELWLNNSRGGIKTEKTASSGYVATLYPPSWLVAHAGDALFDERGKMLTYTNSREALDKNYANGHRFFEIDFFLTQDGKLAAVHDWEHGRNLTGGKWTSAPTLAEWQAQKICGKYTPIDINDVVKFLLEHPDAFIITDTKATDRETVAREFTEIFRAADGKAVILNRFIPQIYHPEMLQWLDEIYRFPQVIYTLYQSPQTPAQVVAFAASEPRIKAVTMWARMATPEFVAALQKISRGVYCHTINDPVEAAELRERGVVGLYTDSLIPRQSNDR